MLFICIINDLPSMVHLDTQVVQFGDCRLIYRSTKSTEDQLKCHILTVSTSTQPLSMMYKIGERSLQHFGTAIDLGIMVHHNIDFFFTISKRMRSRITICYESWRGTSRDANLTSRILPISHIQSGLEPQYVGHPHLETLKTKELDQTQSVKWSPNYCKMWHKMCLYCV